jgi:glycosyltransferase involved in cell wall biosynthesis
VRHRILFVESASGFGGSVVALGRLVRALPADSYEARVLARLPAQAEHLAAVLGPGADVRIVPLAAQRPRGGTGILARTLGALDHVHRHRPYAAAVAREAADFRADLVHLNNGVAANWGALVGARRAGVPCVVQQHGYEWRSRDVVRLAGEVACFFADSADVAEDLRAVGVPPERVVVTWCPVDAEQFGGTCDRAGVRRELGLPADAPVAGMVGMLLRWKGQHVFLDAFAEVLRRVPDAHAVVVGGAAFEEQEDYPALLRERAARLGIADRVVFAGFRRDVARLVGAFDVCVHASVQREPFGMVVAEAMAAGLPVVASAAGGPCEQVEEGRSGFLVPPQDASALAERVARLLGDGALRSAFGERGRQIVAERFATPLYAARVEAAYRRVLGT